MIALLSIEQKFAESMAQGPDILSIKVKFDPTKIDAHQRERASRRFIEKSPTNKLGETSCAAREALTLNYQ